MFSLQFLRDNRRNLLSSAVESFNNPKSCDQDTAKQENKSDLDSEAQGQKMSPEQLKNSLSSSSSETPSPSIASAKSADSRKEPLSVVSKRIQSLIKKLDVRAWFKRAASHEKGRKASVKTEKPEL